MKLTDAKLRTLTEPGRYWDGGGLYLEVSPGGGRYWRLKYRHAGREKRLALGVYPTVSLKEARDRREAARKVIGRGDDPGYLRRAEKERATKEAAETFEAIAREWLGHQSGAWSPGHAERIRTGLEADVFPKIGRQPIAKLRPRDVSAVVKGIEARGAGETADRTLQRIRAVFRYAVTHERIEANPMLDLKPGELLKPRQVRHRLALADGDVPGFLDKLDAYEGDPTTAAALRLLMLTALRPGELRGLRWAEFNADAAELRIPGERMKMKAPHLVPLSRQALALLDARRKLTGADPAGLVFPSPFYPGRPLSENTLNSALARMGFKGHATAHGFRSLFSSTVNECWHDADVFERQLAHKERNKVRAAYHRAEYLGHRRELLQWWADWLDGRRRGQVIPIGRKVQA